MKDSYKLKMAAIAGANHALKFKAKNIRATDQEVLKHVTSEADDIVRKIEDDGE